jgi:hypothetical protein
MSALGQERTFRNVRRMSALPPKADIDGAHGNVCFVPKPDIGICTQLPAAWLCPVSLLHLLLSEWTSAMNPPGKRSIAARRPATL